jgi:hypothetical protein
MLPESASDEAYADQAAIQRCIIVTADRRGFARGQESAM